MTLRQWPRSNRPGVSYRNHQYDTALKQIKKVVKLRPGFPGAYYLAGLIRYRQGHYAQAESDFSKGKNYVDPSRASLLCLGRIYGEDGNYADAIRLLTRYGKLLGPKAEPQADTLLARYRNLLGNDAAAPDSAGIASVNDTRPAVPAASLPPVEIMVDSQLAMVTSDTASAGGGTLLAGIREFQADSFENALREFKNASARYPAGPLGAQCIYNSGIRRTTSSACSRMPKINSSRSSTGSGRTPSRPALSS